MPFQSAGFDVRKWINKELTGVDKRNLSSTIDDLGLKLQVMGTKMNASFEDQAIKSLARLPSISLELERTSREVSQLSQALRGLLTPDIIQHQQAAEEATKSIAKIHSIKTKLDECETTLSKTVYLRQNVQLMEQAFERGDCESIATEIFQMQQALMAIKGLGDEHNKFATTVEGYEAKLQDMVEAECVTALISRDKQKAQQHLATLKKIGRLSDILIQYTKQAVEPIVKIWKDYCTQHPVGSKDWEAELLNFLPGFNGKIETELVLSKKHNADLFEDDTVAVLVQLFVMLQRSIAVSLDNYLKNMTLEGVVLAYKHTTVLIQSLKEAHLECANSDQLEMVSQSGTGLYNKIQVEHPALETKRLLQLLESFSFVKSTNMQIVTLSPQLVTDISDSTSELLHEAQKGFERNTLLNEGSPQLSTTTIQLVKQLNTVLKAFGEKVLLVVSKLRSGLIKEPKGDQPTPPPQGQPENHGVKLSLHLYHTIALVSSKIDMFELWLIDTLKEINVEYNIPEGQRVLGEALDFFDEISKKINSIVFELLFEPVKNRLSTIPTLSVWGEDVPISQLAMYGTPMEYQREIGAYLISLNELQASSLSLVSGTGEEQADDQSHRAAAIVSMTAEHYIQQLGSIPKLSESGLKQLNSDTDFLVNVIEAFGIDVPALQAFVLLTSTDTPSLDQSIISEAVAMYKGAEKLLQLIKEKRAAMTQPSLPAESTNMPTAKTM